MRRWMLWPHVDRHGVAPQPAVERLGLVELERAWLFFYLPHVLHLFQHVRHIRRRPAGDIAGAPGLAQRLPPYLRWQRVRERELPAPMGLRQLNTRQRIILAQRMPHPVVRHLDTPQVGMPRETYAKQIEDLALIPIRRWPDARDGW